jgi:hypothetical protein
VHSHCLSAFQNTADWDVFAFKVSCQRIFWISPTTSGSSVRVSSVIERGSIHRGRAACARRARRL